MKRFRRITMLCAFIVLGVVLLNACDGQSGRQEAEDSSEGELTAEIILKENESKTEEKNMDMNNENSITETLPVKEEATDEFFDTLTELDEKLGKRYMSTIMTSFISTGNTYRLRTALDRAKAGEEITVAFIGGSVTEGALATEKTPKGYQKGYAYLTYEYLCRNYSTGDNIKLVSSGVSGTSSFLGIVRSDVDVLDYKPDIIFVEFAVNNGDSPQDKQSFESLLRKFLNADNAPAVVLLFSDATYAGGTQVYMEMMGAYYSLPMMSMHDALQHATSTGTIEWNDYSNDYAHPTQDGHRLYAKCICYLINTAYAEKSDTSYEVKEKPSANGNDKYENAVILDNTDAAGMIVTTGSFEAKETSFFSTGNSDTTALHKGWVRAAGSSNEDFVIQAECRNFSIVVRQLGGTEASVDVYVDGSFVKKINTNQEGAWNNSATELLIDEETARMHEIRIRATEGSEDKEQMILAMCYSK